MEQDVEEFLQSVWLHKISNMSYINWKNKVMRANSVNNGKNEQCNIKGADLAHL